MTHKPWQQGHFDGLCGVYSLLNSMMYLHPGHFSEDECSALFAYLIREAVKTTPAVVVDGLDFEPLCELSKRLPAYLKKNHKSCITLSRPFEDHEIEDTDEFFDVLQPMIEHERACVVVGLGQPWDHWTVVTKITPRAVRFFDSYGIKRFDKHVFSLEEGKDVIKVDYKETILISRK